MKFKTTDEILSGIEKILGEILIEMRCKRDIISIKDAAQYYSVSERSIRRLIDDNPIVAVKIRGLGRMIDVDSLRNVIHEALAFRREMQIVSSWYPKNSCFME